MKKIATIILLCLIGLSNLLWSQTFTKQSTSFTAVSYGNHECAKFADFNNDGYLDIIFTGSTNTSGTTGVTVIYINNGDNTFTLLSGAPFASKWAEELDLADYNNDGFIDIIVTSGASTGSVQFGGIKVFKNNGNNTFTEVFSINTGYSVKWGDYNNDRLIDFALAEGAYYTVPFTVKLYKNTGTTFTQDLTASFPSTTKGYTRVDWMDYNNDGYLDLITLGTNSSNVQFSYLYKNNGDGSFTQINTFNLPATGGSSSLAFADYNNDGYLDIYKSDNNVYINNSGDGTFTAMALTTTATFQGGNEWGDYNNDGEPDILVSGWSPNLTKIYRNDGSNTFTDIGATITGISQWSSVNWGDYNNDGFLDFIIAGYSDYTGYKCSELYKSDAIGTANTSPTAPSNLIATVNKKNVTLSWDASSDNQTNSNALTYNIRIGTLAGTADIVSCMANLTNGFRRVPAIGNAGINKTYQLNGLSAGEYYWSVQAIDQAYSGSAFATEGSFTICDSFAISINAIDDYININTPSVTLSATPVGGTFSGDGVTGITFNPATAELGTAFITYNYTDINGCSGFGNNVISTIVYDTTGIICTDSVHINVYDTTKINVYDTTKIIVYDTTKIIIYDTIKITVYDTTKITVTDTLKIDVVLTAIQPPNNINTLKVYPNPTKDLLLINTGNYSNMSNYTIKIVDTQGKIVFENLCPVFSVGTP